MIDGEPPYEPVCWHPDVVEEWHEEKCGWIRSPKPLRNLVGCNKRQPTPTGWRKLGYILDVIFNRN